MIFNALRSPKYKWEMKRTFRKISLNGYLIILQISRWLSDISTTSFLYVILWEGNAHLNINQYLVYYDHEKINTRIVNYAIDSFAFILTLNSHRLDALGKVTEGFSAEPSLLCSTGIKPLTGTYSSRINRTKLGSNSVYSSADQMTITQAGKGENNRETVKTSLPVLTYDSSTTIEDKNIQ